MFTVGCFLVTYQSQASASEQLRYISGCPGPDAIMAVFPCVTPKLSDRL
jgi:hypothetical protein